MQPSIKTAFFITGAGGFVGSCLCRNLSDRYAVTGTYHTRPVTLRSCPTVKIDITDRKKVRTAVENARPTHIIHAAALSAPDFCENNPQMAQDINYGATQFLLEAATEINCRMVFISSDLVFDGKRGNYCETDQPNPLNLYARTKADAEQLCLKTVKNCIVIRLTLQYGINTQQGSSFSDWILARLRSKQQIPLFTDQFRTPTYIADTAHGLELAALHGNTGELYHLTGPEKISRFGFAQKLAATFGLCEDLLKPCSMYENPCGALRPRDVSLCGKKFAEKFCFTPGDVQQGLDRMVENSAANQYNANTQA